MFEAYINSYSTVDLEIRDSSGELVDAVGNVSVEVFDYGAYDEETEELGVVVSQGTASKRYYGSTPALGRYFYQLNPSITNEQKTLRVTWDFTLPGGEERRIQESVFVGTPYVSVSKLREIRELNEYSDYELIVMERLISRIIDTYCGQSFAAEVNKTKTVVGDGSDYLILPGRLWDLSSVTILDDYNEIRRDGDGNVVAFNEVGRDVTNYIVLDSDNPWRLRNKRTEKYVAMNEISTRSFFRNGVTYAVRGNWGHQYVPAKVSEAAALLVKLYFYDDATYRDRYIHEIQAGNWRMKFRSTGDETTGSANADILLSSYRNINAAVL